jgi:hypothetical protein
MEESRGRNSTSSAVCVKVGRQEGKETGGMSKCSGQKSGKILGRSR